MDEGQRFTFGEYNDEKPITCGTCGWSGPGWGSQQVSRRDAVELHCPECKGMLAEVGFPNMSRETASELRDARMADGREPPQIPKGLCPWCGAATGLLPVEDGWRCTSCGDEYPTRAYMCAEPTCWEFAIQRYCDRHARIRNDPSP